MDENRLSGTAKNPGGKKEAPEPTAEAKTQATAKHSRPRRAFRICMAKPKMPPEEAIHAVGKMPASLEDAIRHYIQNRPYTTAAIALTLGWLLEGHTAPSKVFSE